VESITEEAARLVRGHRAIVVGVVGYPFTGKTDLANQLVARWPRGPAAVLPTETTVATRAARRSLGLDGCDLAAHDVDRLAAMVDDLSRGADVLVDVYSWSMGRHDGTTMLGGLGPGGLLVVDGSVGCEHPVAERCDLLAFVRPHDPMGWLERATQRDVLHRGWPADLARMENLRKRRTVEDQYRRRRSSITSVVTIHLESQADAWTGRITGCRACAEAGQSRSRSSARAWRSSRP
jgi:uridine kinase